MKFTIRIIGRSEKHSFRSIMGFALIITMIIAISGVISGFSAQIFGITEKAGESPSIFIQPKTANEVFPPELLDLIRHTNIKAVLPLAQKRENFSSTKGQFTSDIIGVNFSKLINYYSMADIYAGRLPRPNTSSLECLLGKDLNSLIGSSEIKLSVNSNGTFQEFYVVGLIHNVKEYQHAILINLIDYSRIFSEDLTQISYHQIKISLYNGHFVHETIHDLEILLEDYKDDIIIKPEQQTDIFTETLFIDIISKLNLLFIVLFIIALIRIFYTISWFIQKYERDLLIMRAIGISRFQIMFLVVLLAELIGNSGFLIGLVFGITIPSSLFSFLTVVFSGEFLIPEFTINTIISLLILSNIISIIAALYPAVTIARKSPSKLSLSTHGQER